MAWGARGRWFESSRRDNNLKGYLKIVAFSFIGY